MTKLILLEGLDRTGKDTLVKSLSDIVPSTKTVHWGFPKGDTNEQRIVYQKESFLLNMMQYRVDVLKNQTELIIWNRSHIGECVYGPMYRNSTADWIFDLERKYLHDSEIYLVYLYGDTEFLLSNDDGESFTTDIAKKENEAKLFAEAVDKSLIQNKLKIKVNNGNNYIDKQRILDTVRDFIGI
jgi:thymidylate kinase